MLNLYQVLNVNVTASQSEIIAASEKLVAEWDPSNIEDRKSRAIATGVLREILDAKDILTNPSKRKEYDVRIGLADVVYKQSSEQSQNLDKDESESYTTQVHIPETEPQGIESDADDFYDSNSSLTPDEGTAALNVNLKKATSSDPLVKVYKTSSHDNVNEGKLSQSEPKQNDTNVADANVDEKRNESLDNDRVNDSPEENKFINVVDVSKPGPKDTSSYKNADKGSELANLNVNTEDVSSATKSQNSNVTKSSVYKTLDDVLKQVVVNEQDDKKTATDSLKTNSKEKQFIKSVEVPQLETGNKTLIYLNKDALPKSLGTDLSHQENGLPLRKENVSKSKQTSKNNFSQNLRSENGVSSNTTKEQNSGNQNKPMEFMEGGAKSAEQLNEELHPQNIKSFDNQKDSNFQNNSVDNTSQMSNTSNKISSNGKLSNNSVPKNDAQKENITKDIIAPGQSKNDMKTEGQKLSDDKLEGNKNMKSDTVTKVGEENKTADHLNKDVTTPEQSNVELNSTKKETPSENGNGPNLEMSSVDNVSEALNGSGLQDSPVENSVSKPVNQTQNGDQSRSTESSIKDILSEILSHIALNSEGKKVSMENQIGMNSTTAIADNSVRLSDTSNKESPDVKHAETEKLIQPSAGYPSTSANGNSNTEVKMDKQSNADVSKAGNISSTSRTKLAAERVDDLEVSNAETEIFSSETVWKRLEKLFF